MSQCIRMTHCIIYDVAYILSMSYNTTIVLNSLIWGFLLLLIGYGLFSI
jgi:hypothetical protein